MADTSVRQVVGPLLLELLEEDCDEDELLLELTDEELELEDETELLDDELGEPLDELLEGDDDETELDDELGLLDDELDELLEDEDDELELDELGEPLLELDDGELEPLDEELEGPLLDDERDELDEDEELGDALLDDEVVDELLELDGGGGGGGELEDELLELLDELDDMWNPLESDPRTRAVGGCPAPCAAPRNPKSPVAPANVQHR